MITWTLIVFMVATPGAEPQGGPIAIFARPEPCDIAGAAIVMQIMAETGGEDGAWSYRCVPQQGQA